MILPADGSRSYPQVVPDVFAKAMGNMRRMSSAPRIINKYDIMLLLLSNFYTGLVLDIAVPNRNQQQTN